MEIKDVSAARLDQRVQLVTVLARPVVIRAWVVCASAHLVYATSATVAESSA
jgi:hypothetical protein